MPGVIIINSRIKDNVILKYLPPFDTARTTSNATGPDIMYDIALLYCSFRDDSFETLSFTLYSFPECNPSMAVVLCDVSDTRESSIDGFANLVARLADIQSSFKNCYALLIGADTENWYRALQMDLRGGTLRIVSCRDSKKASTNMLEIYIALRDAKKLDLQKKYFQREEARLVESRTARDIMQKLLTNIGIPGDDREIVCDGFPCLQALLRAPQELLMESCPIESKSIQRIITFTSATTSVTI